VSDSDRSAGQRRGLGPLRQALPFVLRYRWQVAGAALALVFAVAAVLAIGQAIRRVLDLGFRHDGGFIDLYFLALLGVVAVLAAATYARFYLVTWLGERVAADLRKAVYSHVIRLGPAFFETMPVGDVLSRLTADTTLVQTMVGSSASVAMRNLLLFLGGTVLLAISSAKLTGLVFLVLPVVILPIVLFGRKVRRLSRDSQDRLAELSGRAGESLNAVQVVQAFGHETADAEGFTAAAERAFGAAVARIRARAWLTALVMLLVFGAVDLVVWIGAKDVIAGVMSGGELAAFVFYAIVVAGAVGALAEVYGDLQRASGAMERLLQLLATRPAIAVPVRPQPLPVPGRGAVVFDSVTFHYPSRPETAAIADLSCRIEPGDSMALVGPSGAGKSTLFQLLLRFHDPDRGRILLDDVDIAAADPAAVRARFGLVPQEAAIFAADAAANIRYGRPEASEAEVIEAARAANADEFIRRLPDGYATALGERGVRLSGGQRQRIAIARAVLRNPDVLLLDEATSALDAENERLVQNALERLMAGRTTIVIAHRLATVQRASRIVVLDRGRIVEIGRHADLAAAGGLYARLAALQFDLPQSGTPARARAFSAPSA